MDQNIAPVRKLKMNYTALTGKVPSYKSDRLHTFESSLERDFIHITDFNPNVLSFVEQPVTIEYQDEEVKRTYTPDFLVYYKNDERLPFTRPLLVEIKYRAQIKKDWSRLKPKFKAAMNYCDLMDWDFKILTEVEIRTEYLFNAKFLRRYISPDQVEIKDVALILERIEELEETTPKELLDSLEVDERRRRNLLFTLWHVVANALVSVDLNWKLNMNTVISAYEN